MRGLARAAEGTVMHRDTSFQVFSSFDEENEAEHRRLAALSPQSRLREFSVIQRRRWGEDWGTVPIVKTATWEKLAW
jgi:hypothetical protein